MHRQAHLAAPERCALSRFGAYVLDKTCREHLARRTFARILGVAVLPTAFSRPCAPFYIRRFLSCHFRPKTAAPFPQRWGLPRKGRAVFRREDRDYEKRRERSVFPRGRRLVAARSWHPLVTLRYRVVRRHGKERCIRLRAVDIGERVGGLAGPRLAAFAH